MDNYVFLWRKKFIDSHHQYVQRKLCLLWYYNGKESLLNKLNCIRIEIYLQMERYLVYIKIQQILGE